MWFNSHCFHSINCISHAWISFQVHQITYYWNTAKEVFLTVYLWNEEAAVNVIRLDNPDYIVWVFSLSQLMSLKICLLLQPQTITLLPFA